MESGDNNQEKGKSNKGFAGLSSMVSDVDETINTPPQQPARDVSDVSSQNVPPSIAQQKAEKSEKPEPTRRPTQPTGFSRGGKRVIGILVAIVVIALVYQSGNNKAINTQAAYSSPKISPVKWKELAGVAPNTSGHRGDNPAAAQATQSYAFVPPQPSRQTSVTDNRKVSQLVEVKPLAGKNNVLSTTQIQYCLAEDIRIVASKSNLDNYIDSDVSRFNAIVEDYNSRCGEYRYREGALDNARVEVEKFRSQLQADGSARFVNLSLNETDKPVSDEAQKSKYKSATSNQRTSNLTYKIDEEMPPIGKNNVLNTSQIRYCLAEKIRLSGMESYLNELKSQDFNEFNRLVTDYNARCSEYRYREGALEKAQTDVEIFRHQLLDDGRLRVPKKLWKNTKELFN